MSRIEKLNEDEWISQQQIREKCEEFYGVGYTYYPKEP